MQTIPFTALLCLTIVMPAVVHAAVVDTVPVGNPGNTGEVQSQGTFGAVSYKYRMGKYEVTNSQYTEFLNSVDPTAGNPLLLYDSLMTSNVNGGINLDGAAPHGSKYAVKPGHANKPVIIVSWYDSIRFANWLHNGQGGATETGAYTLLGGTATPSNALSITRNSGARWFLPSEDEWYKAAYHKNDGITGNYWDYPTSSDAAPTANVPPGGVNFANYNFIGTFTNVGAYTQSTSPYGTFDQGGNVFEMNETRIPDTSHYSVRGGAKNTSATYLASSGQEQINPAVFWDFFTGFRVASISNLGDFDLDGDVDGADFLSWQRGDSPNPLSASDLGDWKASFGFQAGLPASTTIAVPEPGAGAILILAAAACILARRTNADTFQT